MTDAGCLCQTFYLVASKLGLGAFYTGAIAPKQMNSTLGLDDFGIGAIGICGCGVVKEDDSLYSL